MLLQKWKGPLVKEGASVKMNKKTQRGIKNKGTQNLRVTCRQPSMQISVDSPQCRQEEVLNSNSNLMSGLLPNSNLPAVSDSRKCSFLTGNGHNYPSCIFYACNTLHCVIFGPAHYSTRIPGDTSPQSVRYHP